MNLNKISLILASILLVFILISCGDKEVNEDLEKLMPNGFGDLTFGFDKGRTEQVLKKHSLSLRKSKNDGWEVVIFIQNTTKDKGLIEKISKFIISDKFGPEKPISELLKQIEIYNIDIEPGNSFGILNFEWMPVELFFYKNRLFGISAIVPESNNENASHKKMLINMYEKGNKSEHDKFNTIYEDDYTFLIINVADSFYLYDKKLYTEMLAYVNTNLKLSDIEN